MLLNSHSLYRLNRACAIVKTVALALLLLFSMSQGAHAWPALPQLSAPVQSELVMQSAQPQRVKIALLLPFTGTRAQLGLILQNAAIMAVYASQNPQLALVPYDTGGKDDQAVLAAQRAIAEGANVILGPLFSTEAKAVAPIATQAQIPMLSFSNDWNIAGGSVFILGLTPQNEAIAMMQQLEQKGARILHVLAADNAYGKAIVDTIKTQTGRSTIKLQTLATYNPQNPRSIEAAIRKIKSALPQSEDSAANAYHAIYIGDVAARLPAIDGIFQQQAISASRITIAGNSSWGDAEAGNLPSLQGGIFTTFDPRTQQQFIARYQSYFGEGTLPALALIGYDAVGIILQTLAAKTPATSMADILRRAPSLAIAGGSMHFAPTQTAEWPLAAVPFGN